MRISWCICLILVVCAPLHAWATDKASSALLQLALEAQGGEQKLRGIKSVQVEAVGYRNMLEQSERPEGPYIPEFDTIRQVRDYAGGRYRTITEAAVYPMAKFSGAIVADKSMVMQIAGANKAPANPQNLEIIRETEALSPERVLLTALDAPDVHAEADTVLQSVPQKVIAFTLDGAPVHIYLNSYTHLPTAVDYSGPLARDGYWSFLGDVTMRTYYSFWWLAKGGIHLPLQWNIERNSLPDETFSVNKLQINESLVEADLTIPQEIRDKYNPTTPPPDRNNTPLGRPDRPAQELAPGMIFIPGSWNTTLVRQDDGIVIIEAPISSGYSAKVIAEAKRRFPNLPIKAMITTSDSWPHIAGIREYVAQGIPIYALDLNKPILNRIINASYKSKPDDLERSPRQPDFKLVTEKTVLGTGPNRLEIYPIRGETSERQMMVYFPDLKLLYGSDPFQRNQDGTYFYPQTVSELRGAVAREHLEVNTFFMMHVEPTPWTDLPKVIQTAEQQDTPAGVQ